MSKRRLILNIGLKKRISQENLRPIELEGANSRALDP